MNLILIRVFIFAGGGGHGHGPGKGGGASGPVYICGYVGGKEGSGGEFSPSPKIVKNIISPNEKDHEGHAHDENGSCNGWKVVFHPMSKMYPFKYIHH